MFRTSMLVLSVGVLYVLAADENLISDKYDYINIGEILANDRLREQYYDCFYDKAPCLTGDAKFFKSFLPEVFATKCRRCTERQKEMLDQLAVWYAEHQQEKWNILVAKFLDDAKKMKIAAVE